MQESLGETGWWVLFVSDEQGGGTGLPPIRRASKASMRGAACGLWTWPGMGLTLPLPMSWLALMLPHLLAVVLVLQRSSIDDRLGSDDGNAWSLAGEWHSRVDSTGDTAMDTITELPSAVPEALL